MSAPFVTSKALEGIRHGFFGRLGGESSGPYAENNMSITVGEDRAVVDRNRMGACRALGHYKPNLVLFRQIHSTRVVTLTERPNPAVAIEADAMVTNRHDLLLGILTADCAPVLLADPVAGIAAAAHAGWKGAAGGIVTATVAAMVALGASPGNIRAAIGPTISGPNYEIGPQTAAEILALDPATASHLSTPQGGIEHFSIPGFLQEQLLLAGVGLVSNLDICTYADPDTYYSHRYATHHATITGRQIALIGLV